MQDHRDIECPYLPEIIGLQHKIPDDFSREWGRMQQKMEQIHDAIYNSGEKGLVQMVDKHDTRLTEGEKWRWTITGGLIVIASSSFLALFLGLLEWFKRP